MSRDTRKELHSIRKGKYWFHNEGKGCFKETIETKKILNTIELNF